MDQHRDLEALSLLQRVPCSMHLHGHHFQVVGLGQTSLRGAMRDMVIAPQMESVTIQFDADNAGEWPIHCHNAYHLAAGMMTTVKVS